MLVITVCFACPADGPADAHGLSWLLLFTMDAQQMDVLMHTGYVTCYCSLWMHMDTVNNYCCCLLWMPQQTDMLLHMDIVNIIVIVILLL